MMWLTLRSYHRRYNYSTRFNIQRKISHSIFTWLLIYPSMPLSSRCDMLLLYKATLLHLSSFPGPAVTAACHCLPIQLLDDRGIAKTRIITALLAQYLATVTYYTCFILFSNFVFWLEHNIWSHYLFGSYDAEPKGQCSYSCNISNVTLRCGIHISQNPVNVLKGNTLSRIS